MEFSDALPAEVDFISARMMQVVGDEQRDVTGEAGKLGQNIRGGTKLLGQLLRQYNGDIEKALAAYKRRPPQGESGQVKMAEGDETIRSGRPESLQKHQAGQRQRADHSSPGARGGTALRFGSGTAEGAGNAERRSARADARGGGEAGAAGG